MAHLSELMSGPQRTAVISDCGELVERVVAKQSGITGMALKGAVAAAKKVDSAIITKALSRVLPDVLDARTRTGKSLKTALSRISVPSWSRAAPRSVMPSWR